MYAYYSNIYTSYILQKISHITFTSFQLHLYCFLLIFKENKEFKKILKLVENNLILGAIDIYL